MFLLTTPISMARILNLDRLAASRIAGPLYTVAATLTKTPTQGNAIQFGADYSLRRCRPTNTNYFSRSNRRKVTILQRQKFPTN